MTDYATLPDRELDALVAEALGWKRIDDLTDAEVSKYVRKMWQSERIPSKTDIHYQRMRWITGGECDCARWMTPGELPVMHLPTHVAHLEAVKREIERRDGWIWMSSGKYTDAGYSFEIAATGHGKLAKVYAASEARAGCEAFLLAVDTSRESE